MVTSSCPSPEPSYADVAPIIEQRCATAACHSPTGAEPNRPYQTYNEVMMFGIDILTQIRGCPPLMPPAGATPLTEYERDTLLGWLYCGTPEITDAGAPDAGAPDATTP
jgi:uncharacterized membrane protein